MVAIKTLIPVETILKFHTVDVWKSDCFGAIDKLEPHNDTLLHFLTKHRSL